MRPLILRFRSSINGKLFLGVLALSVAATLVTTALRSHRTYQSQIQAVGDQMEYLRQSYLPGLRDSLWVMDRERLQTMLDGMLRLPHIRYVSVRLPDMSVICSAGSSASRDVMVRRFPISYLFDGKQIDIGVFEATADLLSVKALVARELSATVLEEGLKILLFSACMLFIFHLLVTRHLVAMAAYTRRLDVRGFHAPLALDRRIALSAGRDELDDVVASLNDTVRDLRASFERLTKSNADLQRLYRERLQVETALRESERRLANAQRIASLGNWEFDVKSGRRQWSEEMYRIFGLDGGAREVSTDMVIDRIHPDDRGPFQKDMWKGLLTRSDYRIVLPDGRIKFIHEEVRVEQGADGEPLRYWGTAQDVTERKKVEEDLLRSREFVRRILDSVDEGFIVVGRDYRILSANDAYCKQVNVPIEQIVGRQCYLVSHRRDTPCSEAGEHCAVRDAFERGISSTCAHTHPAGDGKVMFVELKAFPLKDETGAVRSVIEVINNVTQRHFLEEQLLKTQKLEAVGVLAGGIAHDFNNLLQGVFGHISLAKMLSEGNSAIFQLLEKAESALELSKNLAKQLLAFSKGGEPIKKTVSLGPLVDNLLRFILSGSNVKYEYAAPENLWNVEADDCQISQVVQNIVLNAVEAMPHGGIIRVDVRNIVLAEHGHALLEKGRYVLISIADTGVGIAEDCRARIFDPYFTTKKKGCGLGLATAYTVVKRHAGAIDVQSEVGAGSTFLIYLPASQKAPAAGAQEEGRPRGGKGRILIMDDEDTVLRTTGMMVKALGYEADFARDGDEAVSAYRRARAFGHPFDVVILDLTVKGGTGGRETLRELVEIDPTVKAVVSSGYSDDPIMAHFEEHGFKATLCKPYRLSELSSLLLSLTC